MLTRLEVHGFTNLVDLTVEFGPFTCIAGANGVGKSNVFDAIQFLSLLADQPLMAAAEAVRATRDERGGDIRDLLWSGSSDRTMRFAAEMIVPREVEDDFGQVVEPSISFLRYNSRLDTQRLVKENDEVDWFSWLNVFSTSTSARRPGGCTSHTPQRTSVAK